MTSYYVVAVFWGSQGYGKGKRCETIEDARMEVEKLRNLGFGGGPSGGKIHVIKKSPDEIIEEAALSALTANQTTIPVKKEKNENGNKSNPEH